MTVRSYFSDVWRGGAAFLTVLYHATVRDIRSAHDKAFIAIGSEIAQALVLVILIMVFLNALGIGRLMVRGNMFFSGKMVLAGSLSAAVLQYFTWNPLFHAIDQARGAVFINYTATTTNLLYPFAVGAVCLLLGLMIGQRSNRLVPVKTP